MKSLYYHLFLFLSIKYCFPDHILPSYERDEGDWPIGVTRSMENVIDRWFIDINDAKCKPLEYRGIKGNYNNFASKGLCEMHGRLTNREKLQGCKKPLHPGHCVKNSGATTKYYFDQTTAKCETFNYNGCGGSFNRYDSAKECYLNCLNKKNGGLTNADDNKINAVTNKNEYIVPNLLDCTLRPDVKDKDPSTAIIADVKNRKCAYAAVSIDSNTRGIFSSFHQCVNKSYDHNSTDDKAHENNKKVAACKAVPFQYAMVKTGGVENTIFKYYYDSENKVCKRMETGPTTSQLPDFSPEKNNFPTMEMCHSYCGAEKYKREIKIEETCTQLKAGETNNGVFKAKRFYYDHNDHKCKSFFYQGFGGNTNNFRTGALCKAVCGQHYNGNTEIKIEDTITEV